MDVAAVKLNGPLGDCEAQARSSALASVYLIFRSVEPVKDKGNFAGGYSRPVSWLSLIHI